MAERALIDPGVQLRRSLVTPEGVDLGLQLATAGQRAAAFLVDASLMVAMLIALSLFALFGLVATGLAGAEMMAIIWLLGFFLLRNFYFILMEMGPRAATFGKRWSGLRVVARSGGRLTADAVIARNLMREIEIFLPLSFLGFRAAEGSGDALTTLLGFLWSCLFLFFPLFNRDRLRVGDLVAGTWVIEAPRRELTFDLMSAEEPNGSAARFSDEQLDVYGAYELQTLETVLRAGHAESLAAVSDTIRSKINYQEAVENDVDFLRAYYEATRRRMERKLLFGRRRRSKFDEETGPQRPGGSRNST